MRLEANPYTEAARLPQGFLFRLYEDGDEKHWAEIETSVGEFATPEDGLRYFAGEFAPELDEFRRRGLFVVDRTNGLPVATATAWYRGEKTAPMPLLHWVSVRPEYQGRGLGGAVSRQALHILANIYPGRNAYLFTQTWSHVAIRMYYRLGFRPLTRQPAEAGMDWAEIAKVPRNEFEAAMEALKAVYPEDFWRELYDSRC